MGKDFQKSALQTFLQFVRVRAAHQPHVDSVTVGGSLKNATDGESRKFTSKN